MNSTIVNTAVETRPPLPPFSSATAVLKVRLAEDAWNSRDPQRIATAYTYDSRWQNRTEFPQGRQEIIQFLERKWARELEYRLIKELWSFENRSFENRSFENPAFGNRALENTASADRNLEGRVLQ